MDKAVSINSLGDTAGTSIRPGAFAPNGYTALLWSNDPPKSTNLSANQALAPASPCNMTPTDLNETSAPLTGYNETSGKFDTFWLRPLP